ncbi:NPCBM/NEW2 domain-containing protein [Kitasatospora sp. NPDC056327]|uniref:NPCBM/NEW2 domain-containing protein n=1 Tax=Kitasatospora sp. NPDC056327 TaxID=3345785 RepID=UPI0035E36414
MAAVVSAITAVFGLVLGFLGLPAVVNSPTARTVTETVTATATVTVTAAPDHAGPPPTPGAGGSGAPSPAPSGTGPFSLVRDLLPVETTGDGYLKGGQKVDTRSYPTALSGLCSKYTWQLDRQYTTLTTRLGVGDDTPSSHTFLFYIDVEGTRKKELTMGPGDAVETITLDVSGAFRVSLGIDGCAWGDQLGRGVWIDPVLSKAR